MEVFEHEGEPDEVPRNTKHLGCFGDDVQDRALKLKSTSSSGMDYEVWIASLAIRLTVSS